MKTLSVLIVSILASVSGLACMVNQVSIRGYTDGDFKRINGQCYAPFKIQKKETYLGLCGLSTPQLKTVGEDDEAYYYLELQDLSRECSSLDEESVSFTIIDGGNGYVFVDSHLDKEEVTIKNLLFELPE